MRWRCYGRMQRTGPLEGVRGVNRCTTFYAGVFGLFVHSLWHGVGDEVQTEAVGVGSIRLFKLQRVHLVGASESHMLSC